MATFFLWAYAVLGFCLLVEFFCGTWELVKGIDLEFSEARAQEMERRFNLREAREQQTVVPRLGLPLGLIVAGAMLYHFQWSFTAETYTYMAIAWAASAPVRRYWQIATSMRLDTKLFKLGITQNPAFDTASAWEVTKSYYARGLARPLPRSGKKRQGLFAYRLRWLNKVSWLWMWTRHLWVLVPIACELLLSFIWPLTAVATVAVVSEQAMEMEGARMPWWGRDRV